MEFLTHSPDETQRVGAALAKTLCGGEVIAFLHGGGCLLVPSACKGTFPSFTAIDIDNLVRPYPTGFITRPDPPEYLLEFLRCAKACRMDQ